jgi:hypothetical protein
MLASGHGLRRMHLRHHARPLADDDLEGAGARVSLAGAFAIGPWNAVALRVEALRGKRGVARAWQVAETVACLGVGGLAMRAGAPALKAYVATALVMQATMSVWASHVPHRAPAWVTRVASQLAFTRSPVLLSLAYHERHHAQPGVACQALGATR